MNAPLRLLVHPNARADADDIAATLRAAGRDVTVSVLQGDDRPANDSSGHIVVTVASPDPVGGEHPDVLFRRLWESGFIGIGLAHPDGGFVWANDALLAIVGYDHADLLAGRVRWHDMTPPEWQYVNAAVQAELAERGSAAPREKEYLRKDGTRAQVLVGAATLSPSMNLSIVIDISTQKAAERARHQAEVHQAAMLDTALDAIIGMNADGAITEFNQAAVRLFGHTREEVLGRLMTDVVIPPRLREAHRRGLERFLATRTPTTLGRRVELEGLKKDGSEFPVELTVTSLSIDGPPSFVGFIRDLSQRRAAEAALAATEAQLRQAQKMEAIGRLAAGIAHDFNNLLSVILGFGEIAYSQVKDGDPLRHELQAVCEAGERAADLTRQLLLFSRQKKLEPVVLDLNDVIGGTDRMLRRVLGEHIELQVQLAADLGRILADRGSLEQVIMNLSVNARDAMPSGGQLTIATSERTVDGGSRVELAVTDTGIGMDRDTLSRVFEPFFTTKPLGQGTGLGLSTVFGIVQQSGGTIDVTSQPGRGTTFTVSLPRVDGTPAPPASAVAPSTGHETILLVEDDDGVLAVATSLLQSVGYTVLQARSPGEALLVVERHDGPIHLLLTDVVMPQMSGPALADRVRLTRPDTRVLCMSGYTQDEVGRYGFRGDMAFLEKPLTAHGLRQAVRDVLR